MRCAASPHKSHYHIRIHNRLLTALSKLHCACNQAGFLRPCVLGAICINFLPRTVAHTLRLIPGLCAQWPGSLSCPVTWLAGPCPRRLRRPAQVALPVGRSSAAWHGSQAGNLNYSPRARWGGTRWKFPDQSCQAPVERSAEPDSSSLGGRRGF
jgi:hypothetical protein